MGNSMNIMYPNEVIKVDIEHFRRDLRDKETQYEEMILLLNDDYKRIIPEFTATLTATDRFISSIEIELPDAKDIRSDVFKKLVKYTKEYKGLFVQKNDMILNSTKLLFTFPNGDLMPLGPLMQKMLQDLNESEGLAIVETTGE